MYKIGCDLDGCIFNTIPLYIEICNRLTGTNYTLEDMKEYELEAIPEWGHEVAEAAIISVLASGTYPLIKGAVGALERIRTFRNMDFSITFLTARRNMLYKNTKSYLYQAFSRPLVLVTEILSQTKWLYVQRAQLDFFIEDCWEEAIRIAASTKCKVFLMDYPYNQAPSRLYGWEAKRIIRVKDWNEILIHILKEFDGKTHISKTPLCVSR